MIGKIRAYTVEPWIAVTNHLPLKPGRYLVCAARNSEVDPLVGWGWYDPEADEPAWEFARQPPFPASEITHWYFMPTFPEQAG